MQNSNLSVESLLTPDCTLAAFLFKIGSFFDKDEPEVNVDVIN